MKIGCFALVEPFQPRRTCSTRLCLDTGNSWLGDGVIDIPEIVTALKTVGFDGATTIKVAGVDNVKQSYELLIQCRA